VLAARGPDLRDALERASKDGFAHVILDGKIIACDRCKKPAIRVKGEVIDLWYSGNRTVRAARTRPGFFRRLASPPLCHPIGCHDSVALDREC